MTRSICALAGFATGAFIGLLLLLWWLAAYPCCGVTGPSVGQSILAGFATGFGAALVVSLLTILQARLTFWGLFPPVLLVALLTGIVSALIARAISPPLTVVVLAPLTGYLIGMLFCFLCRRYDFDPKGEGR